MSADSPLIAQYNALKSEFPEALLLSRVGDFYEAYGDDAEDLARSLHIILTSKEAGKGKRVAMAGVPYHSVDTYLARLIRQRRVIAIAEQMEQPVPNRLVRREIVRVLTPGTVLEDQFLTPDRHNHLCAVFKDTGAIAIVAADVSTGAATVQAIGDEDDFAAALDALDPSEIVVADTATAEIVEPLAGESCRVSVFALAPAGATNGSAVDAPSALGTFSRDERPAAASALRLLESYLTRLKLDGAGICARAVPASSASSMLIDPATRRHLDLVTGSGSDTRASLLGVLARTRTSMGSRLLASRVCAPLVDVAEIRRRLDRVESLVRRASPRVELQESLALIGDIERIVQKIGARRAGPRDVATLRRSLEAAALIGSAVERVGDDGLSSLAAAIDAHGVLARLTGVLKTALVEDPPPTLSDGGAIRPERSPALADVVELRTRSRERLLALEAATRSRTGIKSLKVKYTQAFGYYFELPRSQSESVPPDFARRQSLVNAERFTNVDLKELETAILGAKARQVELEREAFEALLAEIDADSAALLAAAGAIAEIDVYCSLAQVAAERRYSRPDVVDERIIDVDAARHPIVEAFGGVDFIANECRADSDKRFLLITGPNMGGKSTYLRQTALVSVLAQMGSYVPASRAKLGIVDRMFTRIGAGDDIAAGRSTFYVEMAEMALILRRCTVRSLLLIDEVGRGTGTTDGLAIAQAVSEYLLGLTEAMPIVLFATHFHELVGLSDAFGLIENLHVAVAEEQSGPIFSHRVLHGASSRSYGIAVAKMAGLPPEVVARAQEIADEIESRPRLRSKPVRRRTAEGPDHQLRLTI
ncbi:MAG TPA: DNA mismatch repair protein MutS [Candidatus Eremiobacteraceae bacterium]|nr:DNA mismatch repair protein MutS [Candidatus Eremiobacteraceae bacterium]